MPEGPEATYLADYITQNFRGQRLKNLSFPVGRYKNHGPPPNFDRFIKALPLRLIEVVKKGKVLFFLFEKNWILISRLGLSGWWYTQSDLPEEIKRKNAILSFEDQDLIYNDPRNFGTLTFTDSLDEAEKEIESLAPDILSDSTTFSIFKEEVDTLSDRRLNMEIDQALMDQKLILSGIGNMLKSEILYATHISPRRKLRDISESEWRSIYDQAYKISRKILRDLKNNTYDDYFSRLAVYRKEYDPKGNKIETYTGKNGRATYWVPKVQK